MTEVPSGAGAGAGASPAGGPTRRASTWVIVAVTLGCVLILALTFVGGLVTGVAMSGAAGTGVGAGPGSAAPAGGGGATYGGSAPASGAFDPCVVGTWKAIEHSETFDLKDQGPTTVTGLTRTLTFDSEGNETVTYDQAQAQVKVKDGSGTVVYDGTVKYRATTNGSSMSFALVSANGTVTVRRADGSTESQPLKPGTGAVTYTCSPTSFVQDAQGFHSAYEKVN